MNARVFYLSHPQVVVDPAVPVPRWGLSPRGRERCMTCCGSRVLAGLVHIVASDETKATETAEAFARARGLAVTVAPETHENDRSATGFVPEPRFSEIADQFFARPHESVLGWERAIDAQARIVDAVARVLTDAPPGDILIAGHGGVGTLLYSHHAGEPIARIRDQPPGGGNVVVYERATMRPLHSWRAMEEVFHG